MIDGRDVAFFVGFCDVEKHTPFYGCLNGDVFCISGDLRGFNGDINPNGDIMGFQGVEWGPNHFAITKNMASGDGILLGI